MLASVFAHLPASIRGILESLPAHLRSGLEEIRIRQDRPLEIVFDRRCAFVTREGLTDADASRAYRPSREECKSLLELLTRHSFYSFEEELKRGFITIPGGHRVGLAGRVVLEGGNVKHIRDVSSFNIRIARELPGAGKPVLPHLLDREADTVHHTLLISPPQLGKTTLIRDLARMISSGETPLPAAGGPGAGPCGNPGGGPGLPGGPGSTRTSSTGSGLEAGSREPARRPSAPDRPQRRAGWKVGIVDERSEIAASERGVPRFDLGPRTDVLDACPKAEGMMMMIRSMSPEVLIVDEIGRHEDAEAIREALHAGIRIIATAHGRDLGDVKRRPVLRELLESGVFGRYVILGRSAAGGRLVQVLDGDGRQLAVFGAYNAPAEGKPSGWETLFSTGGRG
ncbi:MULTISPECIES: stage III sporulation protein AA [unclassified Paenibacillus]|uniref:stage III sporulation protein AA n=1 Tax=unclassified Paenibacillus TaxID=185978 RepID=UPI00020D7AA4|nr:MULTISPECIES: stage III sporulation protein AA [unclassified Paenibacillus]EGL16734.1 stage III sporulation protein AA [Paenibacillus sp. HGF7]EPD80648.1 stage III sporulation protein AA [Paenibacillus sp. HGH0039]